jgi:hypothetical protein
VAQLPFHYYLALRGDWIKSNTAAPSSDDDGGSGFVEPVDDVLGTYDAKSLVGEMV